MSKLYRYQDSRYFASDNEVAYLMTFDVINETPCGYWIWDGYNNRRRWVKKDGGRLYARPTMERAMKDLWRRKLVQVKILKQKLEQAEAALRYAEKELVK